MILSGVLYNAGGPVTNAKIIFIATQTSLNGVLKGAYRDFTTQEDGTYFLDLEPGYYRAEWYPSKGPLVRLGTVVADSETMATLPQALRGSGQPVNPELVRDEVQEALNHIQSLRDEAESFAQDAADSAASLDAASIVHAPGSGLDNEAGSAYGYDVGPEDNEVPVNADFGKLARVDVLSDADIGDLEDFQENTGIAGRVEKGRVGEETVDTSIGAQTVVEALDDRLLKRDGFLTLEDFGGSSEPGSDNAPALKMAIESGRVIWLGGPDKTYTILTPVFATVSYPVHLVAEGAAIEYAGDEHIHRAIQIDDLPQGVSCFTGWGLLLNRKCNQGLRIFTKSLARATVRASIQVDGARRIDTTYVESASGLWLSGDFVDIDLDGTKVTDTSFTASASQPGVAGAHAIAVRAGADGNWDSLRGHVHCEEVYCDDLSNVFDQDGVLAYTDRQGDIQRPSHCTVTGFFRNCLGRAIKSQSESAFISGPRVIRTRGHTTRGAGVDIDLQVGGGRVTGFSAVYDGVNSAPNRAVVLSQSDGLGRPVPVGTVAGVEIAMSHGASMQSVVQTGLRRGGKASYRVSDVTVEGGELECVVRTAGGNDAEINVSLKGATAAPTRSFVFGTNGPSTGNVIIDDIANTGLAEVAAYSTDNPSKMRLMPTVTNAFNVLLDKGDRGAESSGFQRVRALAAHGAQEGGTLRPINFTLAPGEIFNIPNKFFFNSNGILIIAVTSSRLAMGIFAFDGTGALALHQPEAGRDFTASGSSEPSSGTYRIWGGSNGPSVSNRSSSTRTFTCWMIG